MRLIGTITNESDAHRLSNYLTQQGIQNKIEVFFHAEDGHMSYQVWIHEEDRIDEAKSLLDSFQKDPGSQIFNAPEPEPEPLPFEERGENFGNPPIYQYKSYFTYLMLGLCSAIFFLNTLQQISFRQEGIPRTAFVLTPLQAALMYDLPPAFQRLAKSIEAYQIRSDRVEKLPEEIKREIQIANQTPYFKGFYFWVVSKIKGQSLQSGEGGLFLRLRQGEVWRLFSPCILHKDLLHILFNMLWLWYLGKPIEQRIGPFRTLCFTLLAGVVTNTAQYLMSGPFFIGYSGIVTALAGFIWMRERIAPWEGYPLNRGTILFILFFILAILGLQMASFVLEVFTQIQFAPNIANTAHIVGIFFGALLARLHFFAKRIHQ